MNRIVIFLAVLFLIAVSGCSKDEKTEVYSTPAGKLKVTKNEKEGVQHFTMKSEDGTSSMTIGKQAIPKDLGVPIYPGVSQEEGGTWSMTGMEQGQGKGYSSTMLTSQDPLDKVLAFYKDKLKGKDPQIYEMTMPTGKMASISLEDDPESMVNIVLTTEQGTEGTHIQISKVSK